MQNHTEGTLWEGIVWSLDRAVANFVLYLGLQALVSEIINKVELIYGAMASFDTLMQNFYKLLQGKTEKSDIVCDPSGGGTECGAAGISGNVEC